MKTSNGSQKGGISPWLAGLMFTMLALFAAIWAGRANAWEPAHISVDAKKTRQPMFTWIEYAPKPASPIVPFTDAAGKSVPLSQFQGKPVLVNYWANWCGPCVRELPSLNKLAGTLADSGDFQLVAVNLEQDPEEVQVWLQAHNFDHLHVLYDLHNTAYDSVQVPGTDHGIPLTVLYDANGKEIARWWDETDWTGRKMRKRLQQLLAKSARNVPVEGAAK